MCLKKYINQCLKIYKIVLSVLRKIQNLICLYFFSQNNTHRVNICMLKKIHQLWGLRIFKDDVFFCWKELKHINIPNILTALAAANLTPGSIKLNQWQQLTQPMEAPNSTPEIIKINSSVLAFQHCSMHCEV